MNQVRNASLTSRFHHSNSDDCFLRADRNIVDKQRSIALKHHVALEISTGKHFGNDRKLFLVVEP